MGRPVHHELNPGRFTFAGSRPVELKPDNLAALARGRRSSADTRPRQASRANYGLIVQTGVGDSSIEGSVEVAARGVSKLVGPIRRELLLRDFTLTHSGGFRLEGVPTWVFLERQRWSRPSEASPRCDWRVFIGARHSPWSGGEMQDVIVMLGQDDQRDGSEGYPVDTPEEAEVLVADFRRLTVPILDLAQEPSHLAEALLLGRVAPLHGRRRNRIGAAEAALAIAREYDVEGVTERAVEILIDERAVSPVRAERAAGVAERFGLGLSFKD